MYYRRKEYRNVDLKTRLGDFFFDFMIGVHVLSLVAEVGSCYYFGI